MAMAHRIGRGKKNTIIVDSACLPQTLAVLQTRAEPLGLHIVLSDVTDMPALLTKDKANDVFAVLQRYTQATGAVQPIQPGIEAAKTLRALSIVVADPLSLMLLTPPGEYGADIVVGNTQRFGVPMGFGGPHAAYMACSDACKRNIPGRLVGQSITATGQPAYRLALQTRATRQRADKLAAALQVLGIENTNADWFDTLRLKVPDGKAHDIQATMLASNFNVWVVDADTISVSVDETINDTDVYDIVNWIGR